jgi:hypothetical protein
MVPQLDSLLRGMKFTTEQILMPELHSKFARTQALALLHTVDILRDRTALHHESLLDETEALRGGLLDARAVVAENPAIPAATREEVVRSIDDQLRQAYPLHRGQRSIPGLQQERVDLRAVHVRLMQALCAGDAFDAPDLAALRARLRAAYASTYGYTASFVPVWAD